MQDTKIVRHRIEFGYGVNTCAPRKHFVTFAFQVDSRTGVTTWFVERFNEKDEIRPIRYKTQVQTEALKTFREWIALVASQIGS